MLALRVTVSVCVFIFALCCNVTAGDQDNLVELESIQNVTVVIGQDATLSCTVNNLGTYRVAWIMVERNSILTIHHHIITPNIRIGLSHSDNRNFLLHIRNVQEADKGGYVCQVNTSPMKSRVGYLDVLDSAPTSPPAITTISPKEVLNHEVRLVKNKLGKWFMGLRKKGTQTRKWGHQLPRIAVALFLADQESFKSGNKTMYEMNYELTIQLLSKVLGGGHLKRQDLSLYIHALMVTCVDPRKFHGRDLVAELRSDIESNNGTVSPFELLVLCNAGDAMSNRDAQRIATIFDSKHRPFWTDNQAMATIALACMSAQPGVTVDERTLLDMAQELKKRQFRNGTVNNIKTTALVIQALIATGSADRDFDFGSAVQSLLAAQREDGSVGSFLDSYYVLPALANATLLNVTAQHCKKPDISESEALNELQGSRESRVSITYSIVIGTDVEVKWSWTMKVPVNSSLYNIMETVQKLDSRHQVAYNVIEGKPFVSSLMGIQDDVETGFYWFTYLRKKNSENSILVEASPADVKIGTNQELVLWYKSGQWNKPSSSETLL